jgi:hypothetical protein
MIHGEQIHFTRPLFLLCFFVKWAVALSAHSVCYLRLKVDIIKLPLYVNSGLWKHSSYFMDYPRLLQGRIHVERRSSSQESDCWDSQVKWLVCALFFKLLNVFFMLCYGVQVGPLSFGTLTPRLFSILLPLWCIDRWGLRITKWEGSRLWG